MIGFMAGAGIVVRNSIILVDFIEQRLAEGMPLDQAVVDAGAVRFRPMLLTALAVVVGASVMLTDPIFKGLAISLMAGEIASLLISRMAVPILYFMIHHRASLLPPPHRSIFPILLRNGDSHLMQNQSLAPALHGAENASAKLGSRSHFELARASNGDVSSNAETVTPPKRCR
jgi:hypothetical protein